MRLETTCSLSLFYWMAMLAIVAVVAQDTTTTMPTTQQDALDVNDIIKDTPAWLEQMRLDDERICLGSRSSNHYSRQADNYLYTCTTRGLHYQQILQSFYKHHNNNKAGYFDLGVTQRIDGTDQEKEAIMEVLSLMRHYFLNEVLVKPVYESIRHNCRNYYDLCAFWAALGECESNRLFMVPHCAAACRLCLLHNSGMGDRTEEKNQLPKPSS